MNMDSAPHIQVGGEKYYSEYTIQEVISSNHPPQSVRIVELFEFDDDMFSSLVEFFNTCNTDDKIMIFIESPGGSTNIKEKIHVLIESYPNVTLVAGGELSSSAFHFFVEADCDKVITDKVIPCFHRHTIHTSINEDAKPKGEFNKYVQNRREFYRKYTEEFMRKCGFTKDEIALVREDKDLYITPERLQEMMDEYDKKKKK
jgi:hypothetical protein